MDNESFEELEKSVKEAATILSLAQECVDSRKRIKALIEAGEEMGVYIYSTTDGDKKAPACVVNWRKAKEGIK